MAQDDVSKDQVRNRDSLTRFRGDDGDFVLGFICGTRLELVRPPRRGTVSDALCTTECGSYLGMAQFMAIEENCNCICRRISRSPEKEGGIALKNGVGSVHWMKGQCRCACEMDRRCNNECNQNTGKHFVFEDEK